MKRWMLVPALLGVTAGCFQVVNPDVTGPHGEHLMELQCPTPADCMSYARQVCGGDFDVVTSPGPGAPFMLVQCKPPRAAGGADAG